MYVVAKFSLDKKVLVTCLQFLHNLTMGNDRLKMAFWFEMLFDNDLHNEPVNDALPQLRVDVVYEQIRNWLRRNNTKAPMAEALLEKHTADVPLGNTAGHLPHDDLLTPPKTESNREHPESKSNLEANNASVPIVPVWSEKAASKEEQDRLYGRVSHEIDVWWKRVRDANYENWVVPMETVEGAISRAQACKDTAMTRYVPRDEQDGVSELDHKGHYNDHADGEGHDDVDNRSLPIDDADEDGEEEDEEEDDEEEEDDDDSYVEGPLRGLLTEIPNILDTKQIEALHMTVKACIVDAMGSGLTKAGENLQKTRCKMFLALDCGKNLLREMLVFIAVWEQAETQFIFQITAQIIESFHHNALLPYAWNSLKIVKDIVSPAQTVLLRLINYMFRARKNTTIYTDMKDYNRDAKLIHFLYNYFRCRVVPDCIALIYAQAQIRNNHNHPQDFPVDLWDMERAKDGLSQYLDFISVIADIPEMKPLLIEWEATYELIALLNTLEAGVARKPLVEPGKPGSETVPSAGTDATVSDEDLESDPAVGKSSAERSYEPSNTSSVAAQASGTSQASATPGLPPLHDTPHKFPWSGIKVQILIILTSLVAPPNGRGGPGNPTVQKQIVKYEGIIALLNCCLYDGHNEYLKERATLCIKWVMDGCEEAQQFVRELSPLHKNKKQEQSQSQAPASGTTPVKATASGSTLTPSTALSYATATASVPGAAPSCASSYATAPASAQASDTDSVTDATASVQNLSVS
jgi:palmitoyltransferase